MRSRSTMLRITRSQYRGSEEDILALRNRNRGLAATRAYLDWRYQGEEVHHPPDIFWVESKGGHGVGMAAVIYRPYVVNGQQRLVATLGDIALDEAFRGQGLGLHLFEEMTAYLRTQDIHCAIVIPNLAADRSLTKAGWHRTDHFLWYVWHTDPASVLSRWKIIPARVTEKLSGELRRRLERHCSKIDTQSVSADTVDHVDSSFDGIWSRTSKEGAIIRDRSAACLRWRFENHPRQLFRFARYVANGSMVGYIVFFQTAGGNTVIYDLLAIERRWVRVLLARFLLNQLQDPSVHSVRFKINSGHPYRSEVEQVRGFTRRVQEAVLTDRCAGTNHIPWFLTTADKDS